MEPATFEDSEVTVFKERNGASVEIYDYDGEYIPISLSRICIIPDPRKHLPELRNMNIRDDDVTIAAYPKSGTHWLWEIVSMLKAGVAEYKKDPKEHAMIEFKSVKVLDEIPSPRVLNTHILFRHLPRMLIEKKSKILLIQRNPKDIAVSFFNHMRSAQRLRYDTKWEDFIDLFMEGKVIHGPWDSYILDWQNQLIKQECPILNLFYEDLKEDPEKEILKIADFLEVACSPDFAKTIESKCHITKMRTEKVRVSGAGGWEYRKGDVGDWKNWFTVTQNERFDTFLEKTLTDTNYRFTLMTANRECL